LYGRTKGQVYYRAISESAFGKDKYKESVRLLLDFMSNLSDDNITKVPVYIQLYNTTYDAIKDNYPSFQVGGIACSKIQCPNMWQGFLSNMTNKIDFVSFHDYPRTDISGYNVFTYQAQVINNITSDLVNYGITTRRIISSEWNLRYNDGSFTDKHSTVIGSNLEGMLNLNPYNISELLFQFDFV
jgi:hypothetical protein